MKLSRTLFVSLAVLAAVPLFAADVYTTDKNHSAVEFKIRHMVSNVGGKFDDFTGTVTADKANPVNSSVEFTIQTASVDTSTPDRDKHLRSADFFDAEKYPTITFKSTKIAPTSAKNTYDVTGDLTMHGVTKKVTLPVMFLGFVKDPWGNDRAGFEIETTLNRKDFNIVWNQALDAGGYLLGDDVKIAINLETVKKK